jgi:hypothetical protein
VIVHGDSSAELEAGDTLDVLEYADAKVPLRVWNCHNGGIAFVLEW